MSFGLDFERLPIARPLAIFDTCSDLYGNHIPRARVWCSGAGTADSSPSKSKANCTRQWELCGDAMLFLLLWSKEKVFS